MTSTYRAAICTALEGPTSVEIRHLARAPLAPKEIRVAVRACGVGFPDLLMTYGKYQFRPDPPFVPGCEVAGEVIEVAPNVSTFRPGDRVTGGGKGGGLAEEMVMPASQARLLPAALSFEEGACWHSGAVTAWHALNDKADINPGESLLVLGSAGGVGLAAVQLGRLKGALVIATASTDEKRAVAHAAGADHALDPADPELAAKVKALTGGNGADVVYDPVGGPLAITATRAIGWGGRYLIVGFASGEIPKFPANHAMIKGYSLMGLRAGESGRRDPSLAARTRAALDDLAAQGALRPHISHRFPLDQAGAALRALEDRLVIGRAVVTI